ncbi:hypothetical protein [Aliamphritea spongicola]|nr:hypothetical protein [Aliamphritea spongicola]
MSGYIIKGNPWYEIVWIYDNEFRGRLFPLVYLAGGQPGYVINQYIYDLMVRGFSHSKLELYVRGLCHLYAFTCARYGTRALTDAESANLVANFLDAKQYGTDEFCTRRSKRWGWLKYLGLHWKPLLLSRRAKGSTLRNYVEAITEFDNWQHTHHGSIRLNSVERRFMSAWERFQDFKKRTKWDMKLHLYHSRNHTKVVYGQYINERLNAAERGRHHIKIRKHSLRTGL